MPRIKLSAVLSKNILTALSLAVSGSLLLCGCAGANPDSGVDRSILPETLHDISFEKHMDISIGYWDIDAMQRAAQPDALTAYIEKLFNITIEPVSVSWSNYKERYEILSVTDSLPDVFATITLSSNDTNDSAAFANMIENGSIRALPGDFSNFPSLSAIMESIPYTRHTDGNYYAIPRVTFQDPILATTDAAMLVRKDWMENLGLETPRSFEEFARMTAAFAGEDPDGNGVDDTAGYNVNNLSALGKWVILGIAPQCNVYSWVEEGGRYIPSWYTEDFYDVVLAYSHLYDIGGLDPEFYSKSPNTVIEDFASGRLGALEYKSSPSALMELKEKWDSLNPLPFEECVAVLPMFPAPDGVIHSNSSNTFWSESYFSSHVDDEKMQRILALYEFLLSEEGFMLSHYGIPGVDYEISEDGSYRCLIEVTEESLTTALMAKYPSIYLFSGLANWGGGWSDFEDNEINNLRYGKICVDLARESVIWYRDNTQQLTRPYSFLNLTKDSSEQFSTSAAFDNFIRCIIGKGDPLSSWQACLSSMEAAGLEDYIAQQNEAYQKSIAEN